MAEEYEYKLVSFASGLESVRGRLYLPKSSSSGTQGHAAIILAHGLGATIEMRLDAFAERFASAGFACLAFDYRCFGQSTGLPRGLIDANRQVEDWIAAFHYISRLDFIDPSKIGLFGTSFSGGHVARVGALLGNRIAAIISQCPFTDGIASSMTVGFRNLPYLIFLALRDTLFGTDIDPIRVPLLGKPHEVALMNAPDADFAARKLLPPGVTTMEIEAVPARLILKFPFMRPGSSYEHVRCPILIAVCSGDSVAPPGPTLRYAIKAKQATIKTYEMNHFDPYIGQHFEDVLQDYIPFFKRNLSGQKMSSHL